MKPSYTIVAPYDFAAAMAPCEVKIAFIIAQKEIM